MATAATPTGPAFDPDALRDKYRRERDKRLRPEGNEQYVEVKGRFAHFLDDPYATPGFARAPLTDAVEVAVIGGGFGGLLAGARLRQQGVESIRMIDPACDFGGTWYWNRYPGIACDIESYTYLPLLEELGYVPTQKYADGAEILAHSQAIARKFDLYRDACFQTRVTDLSWDEASSRWIISTQHGDRMRARFVVLATGPLNRPKLPGIPGIEDFQGHSFHASRWDYDYTGGDSSGGLVGLRGKRVGIIGTGATSVQCVPHVGEWAEHLYVFQRTPSSIDVKHSPKTDPAWAQSLLQDDASPYDPPKKPALKKRDLVQIEFVERAAAKAPESKPRWDKELRQWVRFDGKETTTSTIVTAEVIDIRPNGTVVLQATQRRVANGVQTTMRLMGEASPASVTANKVSADHVLNLSVAVDQ